MMTKLFGVPPAIGAVFLALMALVIGQASIFAILPPMGRAFGFSDFEISLVVTLSSFTAFLASPWWGRRIPRWGARRIIIFGLIGSTICFFAMAGIADIGVRGFVPSTILFWMIAIVRGILFGIFLAATIVAGYASVAGLTSNQQERVKGFALVQSSYGAGNIIGPLIGGLLAVFGFVIALSVTPFLTLFGLLLVILVLPAWESDTQDTPAARVKATDPRLLHLLIVVFLAVLPLAISLITLGFVVQDRLGLMPRDAARMAGLSVFVVFGAVTFAQLVLVRALDWTALNFVRAGCMLTMISMIGIAFFSTAPLLFSAMALLGIGMGLSQTGALVLPTLVVKSNEHGSVSGLLAATSTLAFSVGPLIAGALYGINGALPFVVTAMALAGLLIYLTTSARIRASQALVQSASP